MTDPLPRAVPSLPPASLHEEAAADTPVAADAAPKRPRPEPTRYGDWELNGKCVDF